MHIECARTGKTGKSGGYVEHVYGNSDLDLAKHLALYPELSENFEQMKTTRGSQMFSQHPTLSLIKYRRRKTVFCLFYNIISVETNDFIFQDHVEFH